MKIKAIRIWFYSLFTLASVSSGVLSGIDVAKANEPFITTTLTEYSYANSPYNTRAPHLSRLERIYIPADPAYIYASGPNNSDVDLLVYNSSGELIYDIDTNGKIARFGQGRQGYYWFRIFLESCPGSQTRCTVKLLHNRNFGDHD